MPGKEKRPLRSVKVSLIARPLKVSLTRTGLVGCVPEGVITRPCKTLPPCWAKTVAEQVKSNTRMTGRKTVFIGNLKEALRGPTIHRPRSASKVGGRLEAEANA